MKLCPWCQYVVGESGVCRHCGAFLSQDRKAQLITTTTRQGPSGYSGKEQD